MRRVKTLRRKKIHKHPRGPFIIYSRVREHPGYRDGYEYEEYECENTGELFYVRSYNFLAALRDIFVLPTYPNKIFKGMLQFNLFFKSTHVASWNRMWEKDERYRTQYKSFKWPVLISRTPYARDQELAKKPKPKRSKETR